MPMGKFVGHAIALLWFCFWLIGGMAALFFSSHKFPQWATIMLPLYFVLWVGALPLGHYLIERVAQGIIRQPKRKKNNA